jgi:hypothetical protein
MRVTQTIHRNASKRIQILFAGSVIQPNALAAFKGNSLGNKFSSNGTWQFLHGKLKSKHGDRSRRVN